MADQTQRTIAIVRDRAQRLARGADEQLAEITGRPVSGWMQTVRSILRDHPLPAILITLGAGYIVGKLVRR